MNISKDSKSFDKCITTIVKSFKLEESIKNEACGVFILQVKKNWTTESSSSNIQLNKNDIISFFPYLENSEEFTHTRIELESVFSKLFVQGITLVESLPAESFITIRSKIQNEYPYVQISFKGGLQVLKNSLKENDSLIFLKLTNGKYTVLACRVLDQGLETNSIFYREAAHDNLKFNYPAIVEKNTTIGSNREEASFYNKIYFGPPGTGKSRKANMATVGHKSFDTMFHPSYDHNQFFGIYKPITKEYDGEKPSIIYKFTPRIFLESYIYAWENFEKKQETYLLIDEINRGNCAEIFGTLFQLLDRDENGFSTYFINVDSDAAEHLKERLESTKYKKIIQNLYLSKKGTTLDDAFSVLLLPPNLKILATMNTSDQSLFPMDTAFKRRWDWEYVPIDYGMFQ